MRSFLRKGSKDDNILKENVSKELSRIKSSAEYFLSIFYFPSKDYSSYKVNDLFYPVEILSVNIEQFIFRPYGLSKSLI